MKHLIVFLSLLLLLSYSFLFCGEVKAENIEEIREVCLEAGRNINFPEDPSAVGVCNYVSREYPQGYPVNVMPYFQCSAWILTRYELCGQFPVEPCTSPEVYDLQNAQCIIEACKEGDKKIFKQCSNFSPPNQEPTPEDIALPPDQKDKYDERGCHYESGDTPVKHKYHFEQDGNFGTRTCVSEEYTSSGQQGSENTTPDPQLEDGDDDGEDPEETTETSEPSTTENEDGSTTETQTTTNDVTTPGTVTNNDNSISNTNSTHHNETTTTSTTTYTDGSSTTTITTNYTVTDYGDTIINKITNTGVTNQTITNSTSNTTTNNYNSDGELTDSTTTGDGGEGGDCDPNFQNCGPDEGPFQGGDNGEGEGDGEGTFGGNGGEGLYEPTELTYGDVLQGFVDGVQNTDIVSKGKDFFSVDTSGGSCMNFNVAIPYINFEFGFNQLCEPPMTDIWPLVKTILLAIAGFVAFKWAWL